MKKPTPKQSNPAAARPMMRALEQRIMFDAAALATAVDTAHHAEPAAPVTDGAADAPDLHALLSPPAAPAEAPHSQRQEIVFVDASVRDAQSLIDGIAPGVEVVLIQPGQNGLQLIADTLAGRSNINAIHILSHGDAGKIQLGGQWIDGTGLTANSGLLTDIGSALSADGDILLYGCQVGTDGAGVDFIQSLASATGADVAASNDATGAARLGGDWALEATQGSIETATLNIGSYSGLLAAFNDDFSTNTGTAASFTRSLGGVSYTYTFTAQGDGGDTVWESANGAANSASINLQSTAFNLGNTERFTIARTDGADFTFTSIFINNTAGETVTVAGYNNGVQVGSAQTVITGTGSTLNFGGIAVDEVRITSNDFFNTNIDSFAGDTNPPNLTPTTSNLNSDSVAWAGVGSTVSLDSGGNANLADAELDALNSGNGNWQDATLTIQRSGTAVTSDVFGFNTSSALFTVTGTTSGNLQSGGLTFATYTNTNGVLTITFTSSGTTATSALVDNVAQRITYRSDTPGGDATVSFTLADGDGGTATSANVTVTSDTIYVTNTTDTTTINVSNGVSFSEAIAIAAADATGSQTIVLDSSLAGQTVSTTTAGALGENLTLNLDAASGVMLSGGTLTIGSGFTLDVVNGSGDSATIATTLAGAGGLTKSGAGSLTLSGANGYTGATSVFAGTLALTGGSALNNSNAVSVSSGAGLTVAGSEEIGSLTGAGNVTVDSSQTLTVGNAATSTFAGNLTGAGGLTINQSSGNTNTFTLTGNNTGLSGQVRVINFGRLLADGDNAIANNTAVIVNGNGILTLLSDQTIGSLASNLATASINLGSFTLTAGGNDTSTSVFGVISGTGALVKQGLGTLTLEGTNTYGGSTTVSAGTLLLNGGTALNDSSAVTVSSGATLDVVASETIGSLAGAGVVALGTNTLTAGGNNTSTTFSGGINGSGGLTKTGSGTLSLSGTNTYSGATTLSAGGITVSGGAAIDNSSAVTVAGGATLTLSGAETIGSLTGAGNVVLSATLTTGSNNTSTNFAGVISSTNSSGIIKAGSGTFTLSNNNTYTGSTTVSVGTLRVADDANLGSGTLILNGGTLAISGATNIDNAITLAASSTVSASTTATLSGAIDGTGDLTKTGASTLTLSGTNSYGGGTTVSAGSLSIAGDSNLGAGTVTLGSGTNLAITGAGTIDNAIVLSGNATVTNTANVVLSGNISGTNSLTKAGASTLTLTGTNGHTGTTVNAGTLSIAADSNLGTGTVTLATGATLLITGATTVDNAMALSGNATVSTSANTTISSAISGPGGLTKTGASALTLSGSSAYTGATNVNAGSLLVNGALTATTGVTTAAGATLGGSGNIASNVTINSGGTLAPGNSAGTLTIDGDLTMASGSTLAIEINGATAGTGYDQVVVNGAVDVSGATLSVTHGYAPGSGDSYAIIVNDAADGVTGSFSGISEGSEFAAGGNATELTASYIGGNGNDFTLTAPTAPIVTGVSSSTANGTYKIGDVVTITVAFDTTVFVTGTPTLQLETGTTDRTLDYVSGSGTNTLTFSYTVQAGDSSSDLDYVSTLALALNGGTIRDGTNIDAVLTLASPGAAGSLGANKALVIDGVRPTASIVVTDTALSVGETTTVTITFNEAVTGLTAGDFTVASGALSGLSSADGGITWTTTLTPTVGIADASNLITLNNAGVLDAAGNAGAGSTDSNNYAVDTQRPTATISVADTALAAGETTTVTITFSEAITGLTAADFTVANGTLGTLASSDGGITWTATLTPSINVAGSSNLITLNNTGLQDLAGNAGTGSTDSNNYAVDTLRPTATVVVTDTALVAGETTTVSVTFSEAVTGLTTADFTVANGMLSGLSSSDGGITWTATLTPTANVTDASNLITLDNTGVQDGAGNSGTGSTDSNNYALDTQPPTIASVSVPANGSYVAGQNLDFTVNFDDVVTVDTSGGTPRIAITLDTGGTAYASYLSGSGTSALVFRLTITSGQDDNNGIGVGGSIEPNGGMLKDGIGNDAVTTLNGVSNTSNVRVDTLAPLVSSVSVPAGAPYNAGDVLSFVVNASEAVLVNTAGGTPRLALDIGGSTAYANYVAGSGSSTLVFQYTVLPADNDADGIHVVGLSANGGTLQDTVGNTMNLALNAIGDTQGVVIDNTPPAASGITRVDATPTGADSVRFTVTFNEDVSGVDAADFALAITGSASGSITSVVQVGARTYTVTVGAIVGDGTLGIDLNPSGTGIGDLAGNAIGGGFAGQRYAVDNTAPVVLDLTAPAYGSYGSGGVLTFTVHTSETTSVAGGTPRLVLDVGGSVAYANYVSGSNSDTLVFQYTVQSGQRDSDGIAVTRLDANGATLRDAAGNAMDPNLPGVNTSGVIIETAAPFVPPPVRVPAPVPTPIPPVFVSPSAPPITLAPTDAGVLFDVPTTLNPTGGMMGGLAVLGNPFSTDPLSNVGNTFAAPESRGSFVEIGASTGTGLQAMPEIGSYSVEAGHAVNIALPVSTFSHSDRNADITVEVRLADGRPLPKWLKFDPVTGTLSGQPPQGLNQKLVIEVIAHDNKGNRASSQLDLTVKAANKQSDAGETAPAELARTALAAALELDGAEPPAGGKPALALQFDQFGRAARQAAGATLLHHLEKSGERVLA
ncbi:Ig-like domain-containing protein [Chitinolyticbacter albus]|uniref:Ig-like domain-containing protein n=1 Tax=Chitinolyticbacter albus TaxID=2961951 RepID=UPI0021093BFD|nr:Ig-like domain-containing protein [Chitinolyticbacter albus]